MQFALALALALALLSTERNSGGMDAAKKLPPWMADSFLAAIFDFPGNAEKSMPLEPCASLGPEDKIGRFRAHTAAARARRKKSKSKSANKSKSLKSKSPMLRAKARATATAPGRSKAGSREKEKQTPPPAPARIYGPERDLDGDDASDPHIVRRGRSWPFF